MPQPSFNAGGWRRTGRVRIRNGWLGAVLEEEREYRDGRVTWAGADHRGYLLNGGCRDR